MPEKESQKALQAKKERTRTRLRFFKKVVFMMFWFVFDITEATTQTCPLDFRPYQKVLITGKSEPISKCNTKLISKQ